MTTLTAIRARLDPETVPQSSLFGDYLREEHPDLSVPQFLAMPERAQEIIYGEWAESMKLHGKGFSDEPIEGVGCLATVKDGAFLLLLFVALLVVMTAAGG